MEEDLGAANEKRRVWERGAEIGGVRTRLRAGDEREVETLASDLVMEPRQAIAAQIFCLNLETQQNAL